MKNLQFLNSDILWKAGIALVEIVVSYVLGYLAKRFINGLASRVSNKGVLTFLGSFCNIAIKVTGLIIALDQLGVEMSLIIGTLSALGVGISLALKDNMASVASGMQILLTKPFKVGDYIRCGKREGYVRSIEMTFTTLETVDHEMAIVPNNHIILKSLVNFSSMPDRRVVIPYPVAPSNMEAASKMLLQAAAACTMILPKPAPAVRVDSFELDQVNLELLCFCHAKNYFEATIQVKNAIEILVENEHSNEKLSDEQILDKIQKSNAELTPSADPNAAEIDLDSTVNQKKPKIPLV